MNIKLLIPALLLSLLLSACGGKQTGEGWDLSVPEDEMQEEAILLTVDGRPVPEWRYRYWLTNACTRLQEQYEAAGMEVDWAAAAEGGTLADYVKAQALADTVLYATVENWAERWGCTAPEGGGSQTSTLPELGFDPAQMETLQAVGRQYAALCELACTEGSGLAPAREQLMAFAEEKGLLTLDRILVAAGEDREAAKARAGELFSRLNGAAEPSSAFAALAAEGDDVKGPRTVLVSELEPQVGEAARALQVGQCSGILESQEGFSILRRLETDLSGLGEAYFDEQLRRAAETAEVVLGADYETLRPEDCLVDPGD